MVAPAQPAPPGVEPIPGPQPHFGYNENWLLERNRLPQARAGGADTVRFNIAWSDVEPQPGVLDWARYDRLYDAALHAGVHPLLVVTDAPCWAYSLLPATCAGAPSLARPPRSEHLDDWARFAGRVAERYPLARGIEIWNEPNLNDFWRSGLPNPLRYGRLLEAAAAGIQKKNRRMPVVAAGLASSIGVGQGLPFVGYLRRALGIADSRYVDAVAIHPYPYFTTDPVAVVRAVLDGVRGVLTKLGLARTPIWVTEVGVSTTGPDAYSPERQALAMGAIYDALNLAPDIPVVIVHRFVDQPYKSGTWESGFGMMSETGFPKPVYCALAVRRGWGRGIC